MAKTLKPVEWSPHDYQVQAVQWLLNTQEAALFLDPGMGKTAIVLKSLELLKNKTCMKRALIIAPLRVAYEVWPAEIQKWADFQNITYCIAHGKTKKDATNSTADIVITTFETLDWLVKNLDLGVFDIVIIDELSKFKSHKSLRFKTFKQYFGNISYRWGLTGSPVPNGFLSLFSQIYALDKGKTFGPYFTKFRATYFRPLDPMGYKWMLHHNCAEDIQQKVSKIAYSLRAEGNLDLPEKKVVPIVCQLPASAMKAYKEIQRDFITVVNEDKVVDAMTAAVASSKCRQASNGGVYSYITCDNHERLGREVIELHSAKTEVLRELIEELQGAPLLCAYEFKHDADRILKHFPAAPVIGGRTPPEKVKEIVREWNAGNIPLLLGHPASMGHGLNMQENCNHICWFGPQWDYELYDQFNKRVLRQGNPYKTVYIYHILAKGTRDINILYAVSKKGLTQKEFVDAMSQDIDLSDVNWEAI